MKKIKKLMSVLVVAVMLLQMVGLTGQVSAKGNNDIVLDIFKDGEVATGVTTSGKKEPAYTPAVDSVEWATKGCLILNNPSAHATWEFDVPVAGSYNIYVAYAGSTSADMTVSKTVDGKSITLSKAPVEVYSDPEGKITGDALYLYPVETQIAKMVPLTKGTHNLKFAAGSGAIYNVMLEYASATDSIITGEAYTSLSGQGGNSGQAVSPENGIYHKSIGYVSDSDTVASYNVDIFETGYYIMHFIGSAFNGSATLTTKIDFCDTFNGGEEVKLLSNFEVAKGSTAKDQAVTNSSDLVKLRAGTHTFRVYGKGTGNFNGFKLEYKGSALDIDKITANTSDAALSNGDTISKGADTFKIKFNKNIVTTSVSEDTVYLTEGDNKISAAVSVDGDTVSLTSREALKPETTYTINFAGLEEYDFDVKFNDTFKVVTDVNGKASSSYDKKASATSVEKGTDGETKLAVTVTGTLLASDGKTGIKGRAVSVKLGDETLWEGVSGEDGVVTADFEISVDAEYKTFELILAGTEENVTTEKEVLLTYVTTEYEESLLGPLKTASKDDIKSFITDGKNQTIFGIDPENDMPKYVYDSIDKVCEQLEYLDVENANEFKTAYKKAILFETINQAEKDVVAQEEAVAAVLASDEDCALLGINKEKADHIDNAAAYASAVAAIDDVSSGVTTLDKEIELLSAEVDKVIDNILKAQFEIEDSAPASTTIDSVYVGLVFEMSLDITPAQDGMKEIVYNVEASDETILEDAEVEVGTGYKAETEVADGKLIITVDVIDAPVSLSTDVTVGKIKKLNSPATAGDYTITISGTVEYDKGIGYPIVAEIVPTAITLKAEENSSEGTYRPSSTPTGNVSPKPVDPKPEEQKPEDKPDDVKPPVEDKPVSNFTDLAGNEWAIESINTLFEKGIISDNAQKIFRPNDNVTREEFVKMIIEALGLVHETYETDLNDVEKGAWYYPYVATAVEKGIVLGDENGNFRIGENISRQDMAVIIIRVITKLEHPYNTKSTKFADDKEISDYAKEAMYAAKNLGIINGVGDSKCAPRGTATRAMAAKVIYEMMRTVGL